MGKKFIVAVTGPDRGSRHIWHLCGMLLRYCGARGDYLHPARFDGQHRFDALLVTGGVDVDPASYGGHRHESITRTQPERDAMELALIDQAIRAERPVMGICRGMQLINLHFGGSLHPHIHDFNLEVRHPHTPLPFKTVFIEPRTRLESILNRSKLRVNALHHQAVDRPGEGIRLGAHDRNGIVQAIEHETLPFVMGLQWHPEMLPYTRHSRRLFMALCQRI